MHNNDDNMYSTVFVHPLDMNDPVYYKGNHIIYRENKIELGPKAIYIDCQLDEQTITHNPYVFNNFNKAMEHLTPGTEKAPMTVYIAPGVYWIDDPDDPAIRYPKAGDSCPFGIEIHCQWLKLQGLNANPRNVVLAVARGQSQGAYGNFTMMKYVGDGLNINDMTLGNFCNIDLEFPLKPKWGRKKRMNAITQAQLVLLMATNMYAATYIFSAVLTWVSFGVPNVHSTIIVISK